MRPEPYHEQYRRTVRAKADRRTPPETTRGLLSKFREQYELETPSLDHYQRDMDGGGDPEMKPAPAAWLGLSDKDSVKPDDWTGRACRRDVDGYYITPLRCALERMKVHDPERAELLTGLIINLYHIKDVTAAHGIPDWCASEVVHRSLILLWRKYAEEHIPVRRKSEAQLDAESAA